MKVASGADPRAADVAASSAGETQLSTPWVWLGLANAGDDVSTGDDHRSSNHLRCPCRSRHSDAGQRRCPRIMASFALLLPVLLIGIVPAVTSTSALHVLDDNLRYRDPPNKQTVDSAVAYLQEGQFLDRNDFYLLPHLANKLSRSGSTDKRVLNAIAVALQRHRKRITGYNAKATAMLLQSLARGRIDSPVLFSALGNHALACIAQFNAQGIASTAWAFATVSIEHRALFTAIAGRALAIMTEFKPQDVGNTAWAFATLSIENRELLHALAGRALTIMTEFSAQNVANTAWAFATLSFEDRALFDALGDRALATMTEFNSQGVANTAWAFAKSSIEDRELFDALAGRALMIMGQFSAQGVANTAWAFAKLSFEHSELFDALAGRALAVMIGFSAQNIANTAWAFATLSFENRALFNALGDRALATMTHFNAQSVTNTAWAFATLSIESRALFDALADHAVSVMTDFNAHNVATMAWAFATLSIENRALFIALSRRTLSLMTEFSPQLVANTVWAFSVVRFLPDVRVVEAMVGRACFLFSSGLFAVEEHAQLHLWRLFYGRPEFDSVVDRVCHVDTRGMVTSWSAAMSDQQQRTSQMEREVVGVLRRMYPPGSVRHGYVCPITGYTVDAALVSPSGRKIAVEVNGPTHFLRDSQSGVLTSMNGASRLKRHLLERHGWIVVDVNFGQWSRVKGELGQWLLKLLRPAYG